MNQDSSNSLQSKHEFAFLSRREWKNQEKRKVPWWWGPWRRHTGNRFPHSPGLPGSLDRSSSNPRRRWDSPPWSIAKSTKFDTNQLNKFCKTQIVEIIELIVCVCKGVCMESICGEGYIIPASWICRRDEMKRRGGLRLTNTTSCFDFLSLRKRAR